MRESSCGFIDYRFLIEIISKPLFSWWNSRQYLSVWYTLIGQLLRIFLKEQVLNPVLPLSWDTLHTSTSTSTSRRVIYIWFSEADGALLMIKCSDDRDIERGEGGRGHTALLVVSGTVITWREERAKEGSEIVGQCPACSQHCSSCSHHHNQQQQQDDQNTINSADSHQTSHCQSWQQLPVS